MNKESYLSQKIANEKAIDALKEQLENLNAEYILTNRVFSVGDRIKITTPARKAWTTVSRNKENTVMVPQKQRFAYVTGFGITYNNDLEYKLRAEKKDGTVSLKNDGYSSTDILTKA